MRRTHAGHGLLALAFLFVLAASSRAEAEIILRTRFGTIRIGTQPLPPPPPPPVILPPPAPAVPSLTPRPGDPPAVPIPPIISPGPAPVVVPTHAEFFSRFRPCPGRHEVVLLHPKTCRPVKVCFCLPPGSPRKVRIRRREVEFEYPGPDVEIRFLHKGTVRVRD